MLSITAIADSAFRSIGSDIVSTDTDYQHLPQIERLPIQFNKRQLGGGGEWSLRT